MKYKKYIKRIVIWLLALLILIASSVFILFTVYKKQVITTLANTLNESYGIKLKIEDVEVSLLSNWPRASIKLKNTYIATEFFEDSPFVEAGSISLSMDILKLIQKKFVIESIFINDAKINLAKNKDDLINFKLKAINTKPSDQKIKFEINKVIIKNTQFIFSETKRGQKIAFLLKEVKIKLKNHYDGIEGILLGDVKVGGLLFKPKKGAFLKNTNAKLNVYFSLFTKSKSIFIHAPSKLTIKDHPYLISSFIELNNKKQFLLNIEGKNINYEDNIRLLNTNLQKNLSDINLTNPINVKIQLITNLGVKQDPIIIAHLSGTKNDLTIGDSKIPYSNISFKGTIVSLDSSKVAGNTEYAKISFKEIKGNIYDFPFTGSLTIENFDDPKININANLFITASKIKFKKEKKFNLTGTCVAKINYTGPANKLNKEEFLNAPMKLNANLFFSRIKYSETNKPYTYIIEGNAKLTNKDLSFNNLFLKTDAGNVNLKGDAKDFTSYVLGFTDGFKASLIANSENFNLNAYLKSKAVTKTSEKSKDGYKKSIKEEQSNFEFNVSLSAKKLFVRNVVASDASINLTYKNKFLEIKSLKIYTCGGKLFASGNIYDLYKINGNVKIEGMDVKTMFNQFENFGQNAIESKHLQGTVFIDAKLQTELDEKMEVIGNSLNGEIKLKLKNGHLTNYEPLEKISDYIFKKRDFTDISFTEINETCNIKGFEMQIQEMEVASTVLNLFVNGVYNFKSNSNINILVPWNNLKRRGKNYIPVNSGQSADNSKGLKLNYSGLPKKMKLSLGNK